MKTSIVTALIVATLTTALHAADAPKEAFQQREPRLAWWHEAKFGMFIHWGIYSQVNGEAIYGTTATPFGAEFGSFDPEKKDKSGKPVFKTKLDWRCTTKPGKLYIHILAWPKNRKLELPGLQSKITKATLLATPNENIGVEQTSSGVTLSLPVKAPDPIAAVVRLELADCVASVSKQ